MITGTLLGLASALLWALANMSIQVSVRHHGTWPTVIWCQLMGGSVVALLAFILEGPLAWPGWSVLGVAGIGGLAAIAAYGGLFAALGRGQLAVVTPLCASWTVVSVLLSVPLLGESIGGLAIGGVVLVLLGTALITRSMTQPSGPAHTPLSAVAWALVAACGFGVLVPVLSWVGDHTGPLWAVPLIWSLEIGCLVAIGLARKRPHGARGWWLVGRVALFETGGFVTMSLGVAVAPLAVIAPVSSLSTAFSVFVGIALLRERVSLASLFGASLVCVGVVFVNL